MSVPEKVEFLELLDLEARIYRTGNDGETRAEANEIIPGSLIEGTTDISDRLQEWAGDASFSWDATNDDYKDVVTTNDRVELVYRVADSGDETTGASLGAASLGDASFGGSDFAINRWTGKAGTPSFETFSGPHEEGQRVTRYDVELTEYVFGVLADRIIYGSYEGTVSDIVRDVVTEKCPEIDLSGVEDIDVETYREFDGTSINEVVIEMADLGNAVVRSNGRTLIFEPLGEIPTEFTLTDWDFGGLSSDGDDSSLATRVQVDGGTDINIDDQTAVDETDIDSYYTVTESDRLTYELDPEKNRIDRVDVWIRDTGTEDGVSVRIQAPNSDGTGPRDITDDSVDIVSDSSGTALPTDGWRERFRMSQEALPDNPWLIIEGGGTDGQDIGMNSAGDPAFKTYYPYSISVQVPADQSHIDRYGLVEQSYTDDSLTRFETARDIGESTLAHNQFPEIDLSLDAMRRRMHDLSAGQVINIELDEYGPNHVGDFIVMENTREISGGVIRTGLTFQSVESL